VLISILLWILNTCLFRYLIGENVPENFVKFFPLLHVATFITGICSGIFFIRNFDWINGKAKYLFIFTAIASMFIIYTSYKYFNFYHYQHNGLLSPFFILLFYSLAVMRGPIVKVFSTKSFVFLGDISYSIYLFQYPVLQICQKYIPGLMGRETKDIFFQYVFVLICFSSLTYLLIEKPFRIYFTKKVTNKTSLER